MVIAYSRVSTSRQHVENQRGEISRYAAKMGLTVDRWEEEVVSGKTDRCNRKLGRVMKRLKKGDVLIITEVSRLSRSLHEIILIMKYCIDNGVEVHSTKDGYTFDDSINSQVLSFAFGLTAEIEHKLISQRTREAMAYCKSQGKHMGRHEGSKSKQQFLEENKSEIAVALATGRSLKDICKEYDVCYNTFYHFLQKNPEVGQCNRKK